MKKFRIIEGWNRYITTDKVVSKKEYIIQECRRFWWILGKRKWRQFYADFCSYNMPVSFYDLKEAKQYLEDLKEYYK